MALTVAGRFEAISIVYAQQQKSSDDSTVSERYREVPMKSYKTVLLTFFERFNPFQSM